MQRQMVRMLLRDQQRQQGGERHGDDHEQKRIFNSLQKIWIMQDVRVVVPADADDLQSSASVGKRIADAANKRNDIEDHNAQQPRKQKDEQALFTAEHSAAPSMFSIPRRA